MPDDHDPWLKSSPKTITGAHEVGQNIDSLSIAELDERIGALKFEIIRLEQAKSVKQASAKEAATIFKI